MKKEYCIAIVLAAGQGKRMNSKVQKQYLLIQNRPVIYYSLHAFQEAPEIDEIILVTGQDEAEYCRKEIAEAYGFTKIRRIIPGGRERYDSVYQGIKAADELFSSKDMASIRTEDRYLFIHDGARPFLSREIISRTFNDAIKYEACVAAMPVKDTIKVSDEKQLAVSTPDRSTLWQIQTPQVFKYNLIKAAYDRLMEPGQDRSFITDDAMAAEQMCGVKVRLTEGSYRNIKITTPEDLVTAETWMKKFLE